MKLLFLDIDGVLNDHKPHDNGYCGIQQDKVQHLNRILDECPDVQIVISSSWRYAVHNGWTTVEGFEHLLLTHGVSCKGRVHGVTDPDPETFREQDHKPPFDAEYWKKRGLLWRADQIRSYVQRHGATGVAVLDDLKLDLPWLVRTDPKIGMTELTASECHLALHEPVEVPNV